MRKNISLKKKEPKPSRSKAGPPPYRPFEKLAKRQTKRAPVEPEAPMVVTPADLEGEGFASHARDVRPLGKRPQRIPRTSSAVLDAEGHSTSPGSDHALARALLRAVVTDAIRFEVTDDGTCLEGRRLDVDPRELRRLRTLRYAIDGKLDLHGLSPSEARVSVISFLQKRAREGDRAVMLVHGKGLHSPRGEAVLRGEIGAWLSQGTAARHVLAFASVVDRSFESGALFVLLSR